MEKVVVNTDRAPIAIGPYSQAIRAGDLIFTSGQIPIEISSGDIVQGDIKIQTRTVLDNLASVLSAAGSSLEKIVKTTVFLTDMNDFQQVNEIYGQFFTNKPPARSCVEVSRLPKGAAVEIEAVAFC